MPTRSVHALALLAVACLVTPLVVPSPASGQTESDASTALDNSAGTNKRIQALDRLWKSVEAGQADRAAARESLKQILWKSSAPPPLREAALARLTSDSTPEGQSDNRKLIRLRLPTESQWALINAMCREIEARAADPAWRETAGAVVRSYARRVPEPADADRPERKALLALYPGQPLERTVFNVYLRPKGEQDGDLPGQGPELVEKQRQAAWDLLSRLDPDGSIRRDLLASAPADDPALAPLTRAAAELHIVPVTGSELSWLNGLIDSKDPGAAEWWSAAREAVQRLNPEQSKGLQLRHIEPVRWAGRHKPEWLAADRASLLTELSARLEPRRKWRKTEGLGTGELMSRELLSDWQGQLVYGDVLAILVIDEALKDPRIAASLFKQAEADRADTSTEYGGVLFAADAVPLTTAPGGKTKPVWDIDPGEPGGAGFLAHGFAARPAQRVNDRTFVAPEDMFEASGAGGRALAHYHFHVQSVNNADYAGPGTGDFEYAATHGRSCVVFTSVRPGILNADYYQRSALGGQGAMGGVGGVQIDLGEVAAGR